MREIAIHAFDGFRQHKLCENWGVEKYAVVIHEDPEGGFWAEVPAVIRKVKPSMS